MSCIATLEFQMRNAPARRACTVEVSARARASKASKQRAKPKRPARRAKTTLRYEPVALPCPGAAPLALWMVHAREEHPPAKPEPLEWFLLTTVPVNSADDAKRILQCTHFADVSRTTSVSSSPAARSKSSSTTAPSASNAPSPSKWS